MRVMLSQWIPENVDLTELNTIHIHLWLSLIYQVGTVKRFKKNTENTVTKHVSVENMLLEQKLTLRTLI